MPPNGLQRVNFDTFMTEGRKGQEKRPANVIEHCIEALPIIVMDLGNGLGPKTISRARWVIDSILKTSTLVYSTAS